MGGLKQVMRIYLVLFVEWKFEVEIFEIMFDDIILCIVLLYYIYGFGNVLLVGILSGVKIVVIFGEFNFWSVIRVFDSYQVSIYLLVIFMVKMLLVMCLCQ